MSRVGKAPIPIPPNTEVVVEGQEVRVKGPKGALSQSLQAGTGVECFKTVLWWYC